MQTTVDSLRGWIDKWMHCHRDRCLIKVSPKAKGMKQRLAKAIFCILAICVASSCERVNYVKQIEDEAAKLRNPPPKPPNCNDLPELADITLRDGSIAPVRIFRFHQTKLYIPDNWLDLEERLRNYKGEAEPPGPYRVGHFDPDLELIECPGVVHKITGGGYIPARHPGIEISFRGRNGKEPWSNLLAVTPSEIDSVYLYWPKVPQADFRNIAGLVPDFGHRPYQAQVGISSDVIGQFDWRRGEISKDTWNKAENERFTKNIGYRKTLSDDERVKVRWGPGAWTDPPVGTPEWNRMVASVRELVQWLATPPRSRSAKFLKFLGDRRTTQIESCQVTVPGVTVPVCLTPKSQPPVAPPP